MFLCHDCIEDTTAFIYMPLSRGACEECKKVTTCVDMPKHAISPAKVTIESATIVKFEDKK